MFNSLRVVVFVCLCPEMGPNNEFVSDDIHRLIHRRGQLVSEKKGVLQGGAKGQFKIKHNAERLLESAIEGTEKNQKGGEKKA